jgi:hypothetical protein
VPGGRPETASRKPPTSGLFRGLRGSDKKLHIVSHTLKIYGQYMFFGLHERSSCDSDRRIIRAGFFEEMVAA